MIQQLLLSLAGYVDSLMINSYGGVGFADAYNGVSAANRLMFVLNFTCLGLAATANIFISQYFGAKNKDSLNETFRLSIFSAIAFGVVCFCIVEFFGDSIINNYVQSESARLYGYHYLDYLKWGTVFACLSMTVASNLRSTKQTVLPMIAGISGIVVNVFFNYCLIFGHFGFPEMNSAGAAIATVLSRIVELSILLGFCFISKKSEFRNAFKKLSVSKDLFKLYVKKGAPLVANEILWSMGTILFALFYTWRNDAWYNAYAYTQNISDLFFIVFAGLGNGTAVVIGTALGAGDFDSARRDADRLKGLAVMMGLVMGGAMALFSPLLSQMFTSDPETQSIMISILCIVAVFLAIYSFNTVLFFILRSGGDSLNAFIVDQTPTYLVGIPLAVLLGVNASAWGLSLPIIFAITHVSDIFKLFLSTHFVKKEKWVVNLTLKKQAEKF